MGVLLKLHSSSYVARKTQDFRLTDERCHVNLFNDCTASIYVNGKCKNKHIRLFYMFRYTSQFFRLTGFLVQVH